MTCEGLYAGCVAGGVTTMCSSIPATCTATVSEYFTCLEDTTVLLSSLPACSAVTRASVATNVARITNTPGSPACMSLQSKCPGAV